MATVSELLCGPPSAWVLDAARTKVGFATKTLWGAATVKGTFSDVEGAGELTAAHDVNGHLHVGAASLRTGIGKRDEHLRSADFFDVAEFPLIVVAVHGGVVEGTHTVELRATVTVKGVERSVDLTTTATVLDDGAVRIVTHAELDRHEFGVDGNTLGMVGATTRISADAVFTPLGAPSS